MNVVVPDYGCGNLASVRRMAEKVGGVVKITDRPSDLHYAGKIVLAGVGAFEHGMRSLQEDGWIGALNEAVLQHRALILGICLGMQLMCKSSEEGQLAGLGWIDADVKRFNVGADSRLKIPHMGWNTVTVTKSNPLLSREESEQRFYFVHSYHVICNERQDVLATAYHGCEFVAAIGHENIFGVQFHPEKSHRFGMAMIKRFLEL